MVTKDQALTANEFHYGTCKRTIGLRGGVTEHTEHWRRNGATKVWSTRPDEFRVPIKYGLKKCSYLTQSDANMFHTSQDCPLHNPAYVTRDERTPTATK